jgi:transcription factor 1
LTGPRAAAFAARQEAAAKLAIQQETEARRQKIIDATPPPPYKPRVSARASGPSDVPMHARSEEDQAKIPAEHYWSHLADPALWHRSSLNKDKPGFLGRHRYFLSNRKSVKELVDSIGLEDISQQNGGAKVTVVEAFAGAGTITSELLKRKEVGTVVALEQETTYLPWLEGLLKDPTVADTDGVSAKDKLKVLDRTGFNWVTYEMMDEQGMLSHLQSVDDKTTKEATSLAPLVFIAQLPNSVHGDQLLAQLAAAASVGQWLFKYGKVKVVFICPEVMTKVSWAHDSHPDCESGGGP